MLLENKVIFLTGAGSGIGRECACAYAAEGAKVVVTDVDLHSAEESAQEAGSGSIAIHCNVADGVSVQSAVSTATQHFGRMRYITTLESRVLRKPLIKLPRRSGTG